MAKRKAFLHVGLDDHSGDFLDAALDRHQHALAALGVRRPASSEEMFRAAIEIRREHRAWGFRRSEVEGAWARICRRGHKGNDTVVLSQPLLADSTPDQIALLLDGLRGLKVHAVVSVAAPDTWTDLDLDLGAVLDRWIAAIGKSERVHVLIAPTERPRRTLWKAFGRVVGFGTASLPLDGVGRPAVPRPPRLVSTERHDALRELGRRWARQLASREVEVHGDLADLVPDAMELPDPVTLVTSTDAALAEALRTVDRLARRNDTLETRVVELERKRRFKRGADDPSVA
ncbi:MAG: hypothetical protein Q7J48_03305 [Nocardioides sp.]|nr:hypothetical protein [Nocardioides sp.]